MKYCFWNWHFYLRTSVSDFVRFNVNSVGPFPIKAPHFSPRIIIDEVKRPSQKRPYVHKNLHENHQSVCESHFDLLISKIDSWENFWMYWAEVASCNCDMTDLTDGRYFIKIHAIFDFNFYCMISLKEMSYHNF